MATTTNLTQVNGTQLTWGNQALLWSDSLTALRTWDVSYDMISYTMAVTEDAVFAESIANKTTIAKSESFAFAEEINKGIGSNQAESVTFAESSANSFGQQLSETLSFAELLANSPSVSLSETFAFAEARVSGIGLNPSEAVAFAENRSMSFGQVLAESIGIADGPDMTFGKSLSEAFATTDSLANVYGLNNSEAFAVAETYLNSVGFIRVFAETVAFSEALAKNYGLKPYEAFAIVDAWRRQGDLVISDMMISGAGDFTMTDFEDFLKYGNVPGYEKWRDFIPGDYEYREAMFRVVLTSKNADRGLLTNLQATVDVPDLIDRGSATITNAAAGIAVSYNRTFHVVPEITLAARGGSGGNPIAPEFNGAPTKTSFSVRLRDTVTGVYVTGSFTWAAHGY